MNGDGIFSIPWTQKGLKTIEANVSLPLVNDPDTDEISYSASLSVQPVPEPSSVLGIVHSVVYLQVVLCSAKETNVSNSY